MFPRHAKRIPGYGAAFKQTVRDMQQSSLSFGGWGKVLAQRENRVTVDPGRPDAFGIPTPVVHFRFGDFDMENYGNMSTALREMCGALGGTAFINFGERPGGFASHEVGTIRMGKDRQTSALNSYCQSHEVKNLFVTDGSSFTTFSEKNPTLTIMALSMRTAEQIMRLRKRGEL
jgi:choline dehydrogenase-like flavoprotein